MKPVSVETNGVGVQRQTFPGTTPLHEPPRGFLFRFGSVLQRTGENGEETVFSRFGLWKRRSKVTCSVPGAE